MKQTIYTIYYTLRTLCCILLGAAILASCQKDSLEKENTAQSQQSATLTYQLSKDILFDIKSEGEQTAVGTQNYGTASKINVLWYGVYHKKADGKFKYMSDMSAFVEISSAQLAAGSIQVPITLIKDQEYELVFVAQHRKASQGSDEYEYMYNVTSEDGSEDAIITRNTEAAVNSGEELDLFVYSDKVGPVTGSISKSITLERPVSQINIATSVGAAGSGAAGAGTATSPLQQVISVTFSNVPAHYDIRTRQYSTQTTTLTFNNLQVAGDNFNNYRRLATLYILGGNKIEMTAGETTVQNISTAPNFKTNIVGNINPGAGNYLINNEADLAYMLNNLFLAGSELENGGNFYLTAGEYDMATYIADHTGATIASPVVPAGKTLNIYGQTSGSSASTGSTISGLQKPLLGGDATGSFPIGIHSGAMVTISDIRLTNPADPATPLKLAKNNNGTVVVSGYSDIKDVNDCPGGGMLTVDADKINSIEWLKAALASGVKVITLTNDISSTETLSVDHPITIKKTNRITLNVKFSNENYITIQIIN